MRFHGELADLVAAEQGEGVAYPVSRRASIKDAVEAQGVPHTEVYGLRLNGGDADFGRLAEAGQRWDILPAEPPVDVTRSSLLREGLPGLAFLVDVNVGQLARDLRMLGFDAEFHPQWDDARLAEVAETEARVVLSRDSGLLKRSRISWGRLIRAGEPEGQLREVLTFFGLVGPYAAFSRCLRCNAPLGSVSKQAVLHRLEPKTKKYFDEFRICPVCERVYWAGSHHDRLLLRLRGMGLAVAPAALRVDDEEQG